MMKRSTAMPARFDRKIPIEKTALIAPPISVLEADIDLFVKTNLTLLRNPTLINMMDGCAISLPIHGEGDAPVGLMLAAAGGRDAALFAGARAVETALVEPLSDNADVKTGLHEVVRAILG